MTTLALMDEHAKMGKISNNLEWAGEEQHVTGFTIPVELQVPRAQLVQLMGEDFDRAVWTVDSSKMITGVDWVRRLLPLALGEETYVGVAAQMNLGGRELEYADCRFSKIVILALGNGGITHVKGHLYLRPGIGSENLLLQEFQEHEIAVNLSSGKLRVKADKAQKELPLDAPPAAAEGEKDVESFARSAPGFTSEQSEKIVTEMREDQAIGTPEEERVRAQRREQAIAQQLADAHSGGEGPGDDDDDDDDDSMSTLGQRISEHAAKAI